MVRLPGIDVLPFPLLKAYWRYGLLFFLIQSKKVQRQYTIAKTILENETRSTPRPTNRFTLVSFGRNFPACPQRDSDLVTDLEKFFYKYGLLLNLFSSGSVKAHLFTDSLLAVLFLYAYG